MKDEYECPDFGPEVEAHRLRNVARCPLCRFRPFLVIGPADKCAGCAVKCIGCLLSACWHEHPEDAFNEWNNDIAGG